MSAASSNLYQQQQASPFVCLLDDGNPKATHHDHDQQRHQAATPMRKKRKSISALKGKPRRHVSEQGEKGTGILSVKDDAEGGEGYVYVRARRGEATDSHSLAERVRRQKISDKMKLLQSLVPGCNKITGKVMILDEVISYILSLRNEVEILRAKVAIVESTLNVNDLQAGLSTEETEILNASNSSLECSPVPYPVQTILAHESYNAEASPSVSTWLQSLEDHVYTMDFV